MLGKEKRVCFPSAAAGNCLVTKGTSRLGKKGDLPKLGVGGFTRKKQGQRSQKKNERLT